MTTLVVVSRKWHGAQITAFVTDEAVGAHMELDAFLRALVDEAGNPTLLVTRAALLARLQAAAENVCREMKHTTAKVM